MSNDADVQFSFMKLLSLNLERSLYCAGFVNSALQFLNSDEVVTQLKQDPDKYAVAMQRVASIETRSTNVIIRFLEVSAKNKIIENLLSISKTPDNSIVKPTAPLVNDDVVDEAVKYLIDASLNNT